MDKGTLFLDEIGEVPLDLQEKLLRAVQDQVFVKVGSTEATKVDTRIIAATNRNLEEMVSKGEFREDLFYRLKVITLSLPALRERREDISLLAKHLKISNIKRGADVSNKETPVSAVCITAAQQPYFLEGKAGKAVGISFALSQVVC